MKNSKLLLIPAVLALGSLASCGGTKEVSVGLGYEASFGQSYGVYQVEVTAASVGFDAKGKIVDARFDTVQVKQSAVASDDSFVFATPSATNENGVKSKLELGKDYAMKGVSAIGAEVDTQIEAFADFCVGKTVEEVKAAESIEGVSIYYGSYVNALEKAYASKREAVKYKGELKAGVGMAGTVSAKGETSITVCAALVADSKVVASYTDCVVHTAEAASGESGVVLSTKANKYVVDGKITSKYDLGSAYAMGNAETGVLEWNVQAENFDAALVGKTADEIKALEEIEGCTITATALIAAAAEAVTYSGLEHVGPQAE
ncbi:MAG: hypothetical protein ACI311_00255 [Bacilli bacterium]